ncbi:uncharacterized protein C8Q71DRAFT_788772 [Rhodofomes roseus]|uniref:DUF6533 domain-containing protein n=1 Tax=Rhodofomes roseus TaxID=34475 RepID=A0ABQ8K0A8_9APHY|nr:uncharacterized protein C8Q71DRAFT_788772 [Rhodofomes roseus]KAH9829855.1 hypothetical protein C8Q71DRAFT_788772 [Rhodofomes roseus]
MLLYDYLLTVDQEAELIWRKPNATSIIFGLNRVVTLGLVYEYTLYLHHYTYGSCKGTTISSAVFTFLSYLVWPAVSGLRVFALTKRKWWLAILTFVLGIAPWIIDVYIVATLSFRVVPGPLKGQTMCQEDTTVNRGFYWKALVVCRGCSIASDLIVLLVTLYRIFPRPLAHWGLIWRQSFAQILLRDGVLYCAALTAITATEIGLYLAATDDFINFFIAP